MHTVGVVLSIALWLYQLVILARVVLSFVEALNPDWRPRGLVLLFAESVYTLTDPIIKPIRRLIPMLKIGQVRLDLSILVVLILIAIAQRLVVGYLM